MKSLILVFISALSAWGVCTGSGITWSCPAGSTLSDIQTVISSPSSADGMTITLAAGSYTWGAGAVAMNNAKGTTVVCASVGACNVSSSGLLFAWNLLGGATVSKLFRISGFNITSTDRATMFSSCGGGGCSGVFTQFRIDDNIFNVAGAPDAAHAGTTVIILNDTTSQLYTYGVIDHNTVNSAGSASLVQSVRPEDPTPPALQRGTANNMFIEKNTINIATMTNAGQGCEDNQGPQPLVIRYNTSTNCLWTSHGVRHGPGGTQNTEFYNNNVTMNAGADSSHQDCTRCWHHQGSGVITTFNNTFTPFTTKSADSLSVRDAGRSEDNTEDGGVPTVCNGTFTTIQADGKTDGNRSPIGSNLGYPCWHQPGRDFAAVLQPMYEWNNAWSDTTQMIYDIEPTLDGPTLCSGSAPFCGPTHYQANRDFFDAVSPLAQSSPTSPFNGTTGMGFGTLANRPTTCSIGGTQVADAGHGGVGYFATDSGPMGTLYTCTSNNTWTSAYSPFTYPHPLVANISPTSLPNGTVGTSYGTQTLTANGFSGTITWTITGGALPGGLSGCNSVTGTTCSITGTPTTTSGSPFSFNVQATDGTNTVTNPYTVTISGIPPSVTTTTAGSITTSSAVSGGTVTSAGTSSVTSEGVCYATTANPTTPCTSDGTATPFTSSLTSLLPGTLYHYRAFATNAAGTGYGADLTFTTSLGVSRPARTVMLCSGCLR